MPSKPFPPLVKVLLGTALFVAVFAPGFVRLAALRTRERELEEQVGSLRQKIDRLEEERERLGHDVEYLESVVRSELGHARAGEVIYKTHVASPAPTPAARRPVPAAKPQ